MQEKFFNSVSAFEYYFYAHTSTLSWILFVPYVVYILGLQAFLAVSAAAMLQLSSRVLFGEKFRAALTPKDSSQKSSPHSFTHGLAIRAYLLAMLILPAVILLPAAELASASLARYGLQIYVPLIALFVFTLVFALSAVSTRILGLVTRITSIPIVVVTLMILAVSTLVAFSLPRTELDWPPQVTDWGNLLKWIGFVVYILSIRMLNYSFVRQVLPAQRLSKRWLRSRILNTLFFLKLPLLTFGMGAVMVMTPAESTGTVRLGGVNGFTALDWQIQEANPYLSLIFISTTIFLALWFTGLPRFVVSHAQEGVLTRLSLDKENPITPLVTVRTLIFVVAGALLFLNYNLLVVTGISLFLLSYGARLLPTIWSARSLWKRLGAGALLGVYTLVLASTLRQYPWFTLPLILLLLVLTYYGESLFETGQRQLHRLIQFFINLSTKVKRHESLTIGQLVTTQTIVVFWIIMIFALTEIVFSLQLEKFLESYRRGPLLDLGLLLILVLYYLTVIVNTFLMVPKVKHYEEVQLSLQESNEQLEKDLAERKRMEKSLRYTGSHDSLTGTYNRDHILRHLERKLQRNSPFDIVFLDIDRFKRVNDLHGHVVGDRLLQDIASYLRDIFGPKTAIARFGGDEFFLIVPGKNKEALLEKCEQVATHFHDHYVQDDVEITTTLRIGIYHYRGAEVSVGDIVRDIDFTVRYAKTEGEQNYAIYNEEIESIYRNRLELEEDMAARVKNKDFTAFYQPVLDQEADQIIGFEQLLRIHSKGRYWLPPAYIDIAEETGYIYEMGWIILEQACRKVRELAEAGYPDVYVAVNISPSQFVQTGFVQRLKRMCVEYDVQPKNLRLEIVENVMFDGSDGVRQIMNELTWSGYKLYLDDFGTGFSNMGYLKRLPIDTLKIDQSFIRTQDTAGKAVVRAMVSLSRDLSLNVIAEGVEEITHKEFLRSLGVRNLQGYYISKPMPEEEVLPFLRSFKGQESLQKPD